VVFRSGAARRNHLTHRPSGRLRRRLTQALGLQARYGITDKKALESERVPTLVCGALCRCVLGGISAVESARPSHCFQCLRGSSRNACLGCSPSRDTLTVCGRHRSRGCACRSPNRACHVRGAGLTHHPSGRLRRRLIPALGLTTRHIA
jgi:hypothetical protein